MDKFITFPLQTRSDFDLMNLFLADDELKIMEVASFYQGYLSEHSYAVVRYRKNKSKQCQNLCAAQI